MISEEWMILKTKLILKTKTLEISHYQKNKDQKPQKPNKKNKPIENSNEEIDSEPEELKKDEVDRLMEIIEQEDKKVQKKLMKRKRPVTTSTENDW